MPTKSLPEKLWIRADYRVLILDQPEGYMDALGKLPGGANVSGSVDGEYNLIQVFVTSKAHMERVLPPVKMHLRPKVLLWVSYPKGTSGVVTDVNRDTIRAYAATVGLTAVAMVSIDDTWSALRLKT